MRCCRNASIVGGSFSLERFFFPHVQTVRNCCLLGWLSFNREHDSLLSNQIKLYIYTAPIEVRLLTGASYKYARSNKTVFNNRLNCCREVSSLFKLSGRLFHTVGAETRKLLGPKRTVRVHEMISSPWSADCSWARAGTEWTGVQMPSKYAGHLPFYQSLHLASHLKFVF